MHFSHWLCHYCNANEGDAWPTAGSLKGGRLKKKKRGEKTQRGVWLKTQMMASGCFLDMRSRIKTNTHKKNYEIEVGRVFALLNPTRMVNVFPFRPNERALAILSQPGAKREMEGTNTDIVCGSVCF